MKTIQQTFSVPFEYYVHFTENLFDNNNQLFAEVVKSPRILKAYFVIDRGVVDTHPALVKQIRDYADAYVDYFELPTDPLVVPGGETLKNDSQYLEKIIDACNTHGIDRHSYIVAIGGGALLDMVGFAAAVTHRGIRHIRVPTTVLAQNDSGIGVKNSMNAFQKKNFLGTFAPPFAVINDSKFLHTLDDRDWRSGISEAVKVALIKDADFFRWIESRTNNLARRDMPAMNELIYRCAKMHLDHIAAGDPFEMGSSRPLDFGHWAAHKLEQLTDYELRHGEAVAIGICLDVTYSYLSGMISNKEYHRVISLFKELGFAVYHPRLSGENITRGLEEFREHLGGELTIMLLGTIGQGIEVHHLDISLILIAAEKLKKLEEDRVELPLP